MEANAKLRGKIPHARSARLAMWHDDVRRILMVRPDQAAGALKEGRELLRRLQIPAQNDRRNTDAGKCATVIGQQRISGLALIFIFCLLDMRRRSKGLPVWHQFASVFKLSAQEPRQMLVGDDLAQTHTGTRKAEIRTVRNADATLKERPKFPWPGCQHSRCRTVIGRSRLLRALCDGRE